MDLLIHFSFSLVQIHRIKRNGIACIAAHPAVSLIAIGTSGGTVSIVEFSAIERPTILAEHYVCHDKIHRLSFTGHENDVIAIDQNGGIYVIVVSTCTNRTAR